MLELALFFPTIMSPAAMRQGEERMAETTGYCGGYRRDGVGGWPRQFHAATSNPEHTEHSVASAMNEALCVLRVSEAIACP